MTLGHRRATDRTTGAAGSGDSAPNGIGAQCQTARPPTRPLLAFRLDGVANTIRRGECVYGDYPINSHVPQNLDGHRIYDAAVDESLSIEGDWHANARHSHAGMNRRGHFTAGKDCTIKCSKVAHDNAQRPREVCEAGFTD